MLPMLQVASDSLSVLKDWTKLRIGGHTHRGATVNPRTGTRHLALLAWALPPSNSVGVLRPLSMLQNAAIHGWRVTAFHGPVLNSMRERDGELTSRIPRDAAVHEITVSARTPVWRLTPRIDGGFIEAVDMARQALQCLKHDPPDAIYATGPLFSTFIAGRLLADRLRRPYVIEYRDEWSLSPFPTRFQSPETRKWEIWSARRACGAIFTTASQASAYPLGLPELSAIPRAVVHNGWEPDDFLKGPGNIPAMPVRDEIVSLAHVGTLDLHTPIDKLLTALAGVWSSGTRPFPKLNLIGRRGVSIDNALDALRSPDHVTRFGQVGKRDAASRMAAADVLLLLSDAKMAGYLPTKLFDYVAARRPILVFGKPGESSAVVERLGIGRLVDEDAGAVAFAQALRDLAVIDLDARRPDVDAWLHAHRRDVLAAQLYCELDRLLDAAA